MKSVDSSPRIRPTLTPEPQTPELAVAVAASQPDRLDLGNNAPRGLTRAASDGAGLHMSVPPTPSLPRSEPVTPAASAAPLSPPAPEAAPPAEYITKMNAAQAAWDAHEDLISRDILGPWTVRPGTLDAEAKQVPSFELTCQRLAAASLLAARSGLLLICIDEPSVRDAIVEKNSPEQLRALQTVAATGIVRAWADYREQTNKIAMAPCNASSDGFMKRMLAKGRLTPEDPCVKSYNEARAWSHHQEVVDTVAPITAQAQAVADAAESNLSDIAHTVWPNWMFAQHKALDESLAPVMPRAQQILMEG